MDVEQVEAREQRASDAWAAASVTAGTGLWLVARWRGRPALAVFGAESLQWGIVTGSRYVLGAATSPAAPSEVRKLYTFAVAGDLIAIASGVVLAARPEAVPRWLLWPYRPGRHQRGRGLALIIHGLVSLTIEAPALRRARAVDVAGQP